MSDEANQPEEDLPERDRSGHAAFNHVFENPALRFYETWQNSLTRRISEGVTARIQAQRYEFMSPIVAQLTDLARGPQSIGEFTRTLAKQNRQWQKIFESIGKITASVYPENWREASSDIRLEDVESILVDEGIPLMWIPGPKVLAALLDAETPSGRRSVVSRRWKGVVSDCERTLESINHAELLDERDFALSCVYALRDNHVRPAQALSATLLDTVLSHLDKETRKELTDNRYNRNGVRFNLDDYKIRAALVFAPVWCAHARFFVSQGDPIPRSFGRHPSVHAVSRQQYTRVNAVIGLMLVTSVLKFFDSEFSRARQLAPRRSA